MFSLRAITRAVPRTFAKSVARPLRVAQKPAVFQPVFKLTSRPAYAAFSTTRPTWGSGDVDVELAAKFQDELALETESGDNNKLPESLKYFLDNGPFELQDKAGQEEVVLTRTFGDEKIRVSFSISDLQNLNDEFNDNALEDELDATDRAINQPGSDPKHPNVTSEDKVSPADRENEEFGEEAEPAFPVNVSVTIEKPGKGAMHVDAVAGSGMFNIVDLHYFEKADMATAESPEKEFTRRDLYAGPPFANLDEDLQSLIERYLDERGVDTALATFIPDYIDFKEQREYVNWLNSMRKFVEA